MSDAGRLYAFGPSDGGRLGFKAVVGAGGVSAPRIVRAPCLAEERVVAAAGGQMHSSCVCASGKVRALGRSVCVVLCFCVFCFVSLVGCLIGVYLLFWRRGWDVLLVGVGGVGVVSVGFGMSSL